MADEPTGNLDTKSSEEIMGILHQLHHQGATIVMVTHDPDRVAMPERVITVRDGEIVNEQRRTEAKQQGELQHAG